MRTRINSALKSAMKDKDQTRTSTLRLIIAAIKEREIAARGGDDAAELGEEDVTAILSKMVKQREESARAYEEGERPELAKQERDEIKIIREFLPKPLSEDEQDAAVAKAIKEVGADSLKDMGKVMGVLKSRYNGRMDFARAGAAVKTALN